MFGTNVFRLQVASRFVLGVVLLRRIFIFDSAAFSDTSAITQNRPMSIT
jgi:hypothetical protein